MATNLENKINRVATNVTDALAAIAAKGVDITGMNSDNLAALIEALATLPALTTPGAAADLRTGKQLIDGNGSIVTGTMPEQAAQTITPGTSNKTIASGRYLTGTQTIKGDSNLIAANIASGKTIFGVKGSYTGGANLKSGTFTLSSQTKTYTLTHGVGKTPNFALAILESTYYMDYTFLCFTLNYGNTSWIIQNFWNTNYMMPETKLTKTTSATITNSQSDGFGKATSTSIVFSRNGDSNYLANTYRYIVGVV